MRFAAAAARGHRAGAAARRCALLRPLRLLAGEDVGAVAARPVERERLLGYELAEAHSMAWRA